MKSNIWFKAGLVSIYGSSIDASPHCHHAIQLVWARDGSCCKLDNKAISTPLIIGSNVEHQLQLDEGWILLVEPTSDLGLVLSDKLLDQPSKTFNVSSSTFNHSEPTDD